MKQTQEDSRCWEWLLFRECSSINTNFISIGRRRKKKEKKKAIVGTTGAKLEHSLQKSFRHLAGERGLSFKFTLFLKKRSCHHGCYQTIFSLRITY
jgi:ABC-type branched-subunit amino acid transport system substrate-binding protein